MPAHSALGKLVFLAHRERTVCCNWEGRARHKRKTRLR